MIVQIRVLAVARPLGRGLSGYGAGTYGGGTYGSVAATALKAVARSRARVVLARARPT